jgi:hypothetical protein
MISSSTVGFQKFVADPLVSFVPAIRGGWFKGEEASIDRPKTEGLDAEGWRSSKFIPMT